MINYIFFIYLKFRLKSKITRKKKTENTIKNSNNRISSISNEIDLEKCAKFKIKE